MIDRECPQFLKLVAAEVARKRGPNGKKRIRGYHEAWGRLQEEVDEFKAEVQKKPENRDHANALRELVQVAATAMRAAEDLIMFGKSDSDPV